MLYAFVLLAVHDALPICAIDVALDGDFGEDIVPFNGEFNADEINAAEILDDLLNLASR